MTMKAIDQVVESDVLVIGSGLAGSLAAIGCHKLGKKVVIVNKGRLCWGGATIVCQARGTDICFPTDDKKVWMNEIVEASEYVADQEWVKVFLEEGYGYALELNRLGKRYNEVILPPDPQGRKGELWRFRGYGQKTPMRVFVDCSAAAATLRKKIVSDKITFLERVEMTRLLTDGQRIVGALGFNYRDGKTYLFRTKAVVVATGRCSFTVEVVDAWGEGVALAYQAGARMRSLDRGGAHVRPRNVMYAGILGDAIPNGLPYCLGAKVVNRLGEAFFDNVSPEMKASGRVGLSTAIKREIAEGRGPIFEDYTQIPPEVKAVLRRSKKAAWKLAKTKYGVDVFEARIPLADREEQTVVPAAGTRPGAVEVDHQCASNVPGLYAVGDSACSGIVAPHPLGAGLAWAILTGSKVGKSVAGYVTSAPPSTLTDKEIVAQAKKHIDSLALPLTRTSGLSADEVSSSLLRCMIPYDKVHSDKGSMEKALGEIARLQNEDLANIKARDYHELKKAVEVQSIVLVSEMILRSELFREESRFGVQRKDFPMTDNINWLKWIIVEKRDGKMHVYAKDVPTPYIEPPRTIYPPRVARL